MAVNPAPKPWRYYVRQIHWITAAFTVSCLCLYALSGLLLNNEDLFAPAPVTTRIERPLSAALTAQVGGLKDGASLPPATAAIVGRLFSADLRYATLHAGKDKMTINVPDPGKRTTIEADTKAGLITLVRTDRGPLAYFTDLHKGKNVPPLWHSFINVFAVSVLLFSISGFILLAIQTRARKMTWPVVGLGLGLPALFLIVILHL